MLFLYACSSAICRTLEILEFVAWPIGSSTNSSSSALLLLRWSTHAIAISATASIRPGTISETRLVASLDPDQKNVRRERLAERDKVRQGETGPKNTHVKERVCMREQACEGKRARERVF